MRQAVTPPYLFDRKALDRLGGFLDEATLLAFDLDGTLAPIVPDPAAIRIPDAVLKAFAALNARAPVAVITGRSRSDAMTHLGVAPRYLIGNHGVEGLPNWGFRENAFVLTVQKWENQLELLLCPKDREGIAIENKGASLSIHYRHALNIQAAQAAILGVIHQLVPAPRRISGKFIENLLPADAPDKGMALALLMESEGFSKAFFAGDDETDEHVFRLHRKNILTVRVGESPGTAADLYLQGQYEVARLLAELHERLERRSRGENTFA